MRVEAGILETAPHPVGAPARQDAMPRVGLTPRAGRQTDTFSREVAPRSVLHAGFSGQDLPMSCEQVGQVLASRTAGDLDDHRPGPVEDVLERRQVEGW